MGFGYGSSGQFSGPTWRGVLTINVPVVYMARYVMVLGVQHPFQGPLKGVGPGNRGCLGSEMAIGAKRVPFGPKKVEISRVHPFQCPDYRTKC
jgi:hypothetical protein